MENLIKALEDLELHSSSLPSSSAFKNLEWEDLDYYFTSLHTNLLHKFSIHQSIEHYPSSKISGKNINRSLHYEPYPARPKWRVNRPEWPLMALEGLLLVMTRKRDWKRFHFWHLLAAFELVDNVELDLNELIEYAVGIAR